MGGPGDRCLASLRTTDGGPLLLAFVSVKETRNAHTIRKLVVGIGFTVYYRYGACVASSFNFIYPIIAFY